MSAVSAIYQVFVRSFADSNGDGIGDLAGLTAKLDYISGLGCDAIWLMPIHPSPSYHKYDVLDYYSIDPEYGTMSEFENLISITRQKGIKIIMDLVINHCSSSHSWFQKALQHNPEYRDYFVWRNKSCFRKKKDRQKTASGDSDNTIIWHEAKNQKELFYAYFWEGMPNLNYDNPKVRNEVTSIAKFWIAKGVSGFRLDAAMHLYPEDRMTDTINFWQEFKRQLQQEKDDIILIGEVWTDMNTQVRFADCFTSMFNFDLSYSILETVKRGHLASAHVSAAAWKAEDRGSPADIFKEAPEITEDFMQSTFLSNHDQERVFSFLNKSTEKAKLAAAILLTLPGIPVIYYGEEIGMSGKKPDEYIREPFLWTDEYQTRWMKPKYNKQITRHADELRQHYEQLLELRKTIPNWNQAKIHSIESEDPELFVFEIETEGSILEVTHNLSSEVKLMMNDAENMVYATGLFSKEHIAPYQSIIKKKNQVP